MGSSYGGQAAIFAALEYPEIFGLVGAFSPSWYVTPEVVARYGRKYPIRYFVNSGTMECTWVAKNILRNYSSDYVPNVVGVARALREQGQEVRLDIDEDGYHGEGYWALKFPEAYLHLFDK